MNGKKKDRFDTGGRRVHAGSCLGAITYGVVKAQTPTPTTPTAPNNAGQPGFGRGMRGGGYTDDGLAAALGISVEQLQTAEQTARDEALKQAVAAGLITQAQADELAQRGLDGRHFGGIPSTPTPLTCSREVSAANSASIGEFGPSSAEASLATSAATSLMRSRRSAFSTRSDAQASSVSRFMAPRSRAYRSRSSLV